jgi:hypothetical protein
MRWHGPNRAPHRSPGHFTVLPLADIRLVPLSPNCITFDYESGCNSCSHHRYIPDPEFIMRCENTLGCPTLPPLRASRFSPRSTPDQSDLRTLFGTEEGGKALIFLFRPRNDPFDPG